MTQGKHALFPPQYNSCADTFRTQNVCDARVMKMRCAAHESDVLCNVPTVGSMVNENVTSVIGHQMVIVPPEARWHPRALVEES